MQRRLQTETMEGRLSSDFTPVEARLASDSLRLQRLPSPQGLVSSSRGRGSQDMDWRV